MTDILDLPGWQVTGLTLKDNEYLIKGSYCVISDVCIKCGVIGRLYRHGPKVVTYRDSPIRGYPAKLVATVQRFKCRDCSATFLQKLAGVDNERRVTQRCRQYIETQSLRTTFTNVANAVGCDEKTVRTLAGEYAKRLDANYVIQTPDWLGIDETHLLGDMRCVLTDVERRAPVDMLVGRSKNLVGAWLANLPNRHLIKGVTIDMWRGYRDLARVWLPQAVVVVDKFHVLAMVNRSLDKVRKDLRGNQSDGERRRLMRSRHMLLMRPGRLKDNQMFALDGWLKNVPELAEAYELKESFFRIYDLPASEAKMALKAWPNTVSARMKPHFKEIITALSNWEPEILNYFDHTFTNAYTEALNGIIKIINRQGRGYTFDVLRARVLFRRYERLDEAPSIFSRAIQELKRVLLSEQSSTCYSCIGVFAPEDLLLTHLVKLEQGVVREDAALLCLDCRHRLDDHAIPLN